MLDNSCSYYFTERIWQILDEGSYGCCIFVDFWKTCDTVDHKILLYKLKCYRIREVYNEWLKFYLSDRKQFVSLNGYNSDYMLIHCSVPQGSVLGPLFSEFISMIPIRQLNTAKCVTFPMIQIFFIQVSQ